MTFRVALITALGIAFATRGFSQFDFQLEGRDVQIHSFASQGFMYSNQNNYMTLPTNTGSFGWTDFGANISTNLTDKLHISAQIHDYNLGALGGWKPDLDYAVGDFKFKDWLGIRGGKVKTVLGLYNDTQDLEFLQTWALMPQSTYPIDTRGDTIAHVGGDLYGNISAKKFGSFAYTLYGGERLTDKNGGFAYSLGLNQQSGPTTFVPNSIRTLNSYGGPQYGSDLRWTTPVKGILAGISLMKQDITTHATYVSTGKPYTKIPYFDNTVAFYAQYSLGNLRFDSEYRHETEEYQGTNITGGLLPPYFLDYRSGYVSVAYRFNKWVELGTYNSRIYPNWPTIHSLPANHLYDQAMTLRLDLNRYLDFKIEGHIMSGAPVGSPSHGFYAKDNLNGVLPETNLLVLRLGYHL